MLDFCVCVRETEREGSHMWPTRADRSCLRPNPTVSMPSLPSSTPLYLSLSLHQGLSVELLCGSSSVSINLDVCRAGHNRPALYTLPGEVSQPHNPTTPPHSSDTYIYQSGCRNVAPAQCMAEIMCLDGGKYESTSWSRNNWLRCFDLVTLKWHEGNLKIETCGIKCVSCEVLGASWRCITSSK